jgi:large subunit ribosomal protein L29
MAKSKQKNPLEDYRGMSDEALNDHIEDFSLQLKKMQFSHAVNPIENPMTIRTTRRMIARLKTEQHKRALAS